MPELVTLEDGSVRWDYDMPAKPEKPAKKTAAKKPAQKES